MNAVPRTLVNGVAISLGLVALLGLYLGAKGSLDRPISEGAGPVMASSGAAAAMRNAATDARPLAEPVAPPESSRPAAPKTTTVAQADDEADSEPDAAPSQPIVAVVPPPPPAPAPVEAQPKPPRDDSNLPPF